MKRTLIAETNEQFKSFSPYVASINNGGTVAFQSTLANGGAGIFSSSGGLGIYSGTDPLTDKILAVGEAMLGSVVTEFALNPVSINDAGQLAIRIKLANGREMIIRYEP